MISICIVVLFLFNIFSLGYSYVSSKLDMIDYQPSGGNWPLVTYSDLNGFDSAQVILPEEDIFRDKNVVNILLLGTDERSDTLSSEARADAILVLSLNKLTNTIKLVSFEREMWVKMPNGKLDILNHAFFTVDHNGCLNVCRLTLIWM